MPLIGPGAPIAYRQKRVSLVAPGDPVPDGDGGYTQGEAPLVPPQMWAWVQPASKADLERLAGGTVLSQATHLVRLPYHVEITTETVILVENYPKPDRRFSVVYIGNPDERNAALDLICAEVVQ